MRIYFAPCGIALGHAGRCIPIAKKFQANGSSVYFSTYGEAVQFVSKAGFQVGEVPPIKMYERSDGTFDFRRTLAIGPKSLLTFSRQIGAELNLIEHFKPDLVISDSRLSTVLAARMRRIIPVLILHQLRIMVPHTRPITDKSKLAIKRQVERLGLEVLGGMWKLSRVIIVPDFPPPYTIAKANVVPSYQYINKIKLVGPVIPKYPGALPPSDELKRSMGFDDRPLIFAAISGTYAEKKMITDKLVSLFNEFPNKYNIVISRGLSDSNHAVPNGSGKHLRIYNWVDDRYKYLKACDLLVTRGGHNTVGEAIYYKKPMVIIPTIGHSEHQGIAESVSNMNLGKTIQQNELDYLSLYNSINELLTSPFYLRNVQRAAKFAEKYHAVDSIYKTVCEILNVPFKTF